MKNGQISVEYIVILGMLIFVLLPIIFYATQSTTDTTRFNNADIAVKLIRESADRVYALGPGNKEKVSITLPSGVNNFEVSTKGISLQLQYRGSSADFAVTTNANLTGLLPKTSGTYFITLLVLDNGVVNLSYAS